MNKIQKCLASALFLLCALFSVSSFAQMDIRSSVVRIFTVQNNPNYSRPWMMYGAKSIGGSGFVFEKGLILTNAHVVSNSTFIQVRLYGQAEKHVAKVVAISHDADLAILTLKDQTVLEGVKPLPLGELPELQQEVVVYGYPEGGSTLSITKGVVSRIENRRYAHSYRKLLTAQLDAAINSGNSGGPVVINNKVVGVAMQSLKKSNDIGYMVPIPIVKHFLTDLRDGKYDGFPHDGIIIQTLENKSFREKYVTSQ